MAEKFSPMTDEQRQRWKETGLFPIEQWGTGPDATPLVCPLPDRAMLRKLAEAIPSHIQSSGWYATGQRYDSRTVHSVYGDNFRGMGRQAIASVISAGSYSGPLADFIAAACPRTILRLLDRIEELEQQLAAASAQVPDGHKLVPIEPPDALAAHLTDYSLGDNGMSERDRSVVRERLRKRWAAILAAIPDGVGAPSAEAQPARNADVGMGSAEGSKP